MTLTEEQREAIRVISKLPMAIGCQLCHPYIMKNYGSHFIVLRDMIDSSGTVEPTGGFDLERARGLRDFLQDDCAEVGDVWAEMVAEIERLRPFEIAARDLDSDLTKIAGERDDQAARIKELEADLEQAERVIEARSEVIDQQAALTKSLKKEIRRLKHESKVEQEFTNSYILHLHEAEARIKELEADNQNLVTMNKALMKNDWILRDNNGKYRKRSQKAELLNKSLKSKIGPDARPPCWQITEERIGLLEYCLETLLDAPDIEEIPGPGHSIEMLRAMLREAEQ